MKGDGFINININIRGIYKLSNPQPYVEIYDSNGCIISCGYTKCGLYKVCLNKCSFYKVKVIFIGKTICSNIYTNKCNFDVFFNIGSSSKNKFQTITFRLSDHYYNLPISKGVLNFG